MLINTLAIEYSYKTFLVYVRIDDKIFSLIRSRLNFNSDNFSIPRIFDDFLIENKIDLNQIKLIINSCGPGSFTGLRISLSFVKGLSLGLSIPFVNISTFDVFANLVKTDYDLFVLSFTAGRYFLGRYKNSKLLGEIFCFSKSDLFKYLDQVGFNSVIIGNGLEYIGENFSHKLEIIKDFNSFGKVLTELGLRKYLRINKSDDILSGPFYVRLSDAEINSYLLK